MTIGLLRLAAVIAVICWYLVVRRAFWTYVLKGNSRDTVEVIFSYYLAIPITALSCIFMFLAGVALKWVAEGFIQ